MAKTTHTITIRRIDPTDSDSGLEYAHESLEGKDETTRTSQGVFGKSDAFVVAPKDEVNWKAKAPIGNFCLLFVDKPPFNGKVVVLGAQAGNTTGIRVAKNLDVSGTPENFQYAVMVNDDGKIKFDDPFMDIDDGAGGEGDE